MNGILVDKMYEIKLANLDNIDSIRSFLFEVPAIDNIDEEVLKNASVLYLDDKIYGIISYELFSSLDFKEINKEDIFIEEENYKNSKFKDTKLMIRSVN